MNCPHCSAPNLDDARFCGTCGKATSSTEPASNPPMESPFRDMIGREIAGRYRILAKLGEGGMGTVYRAEQISLKRTVALKLLRPDVGGSEMLLRRFNAEAEAVAKLSHPNTVNIYDFGQDVDGLLFIAMEYIEGQSLRQAIHNEAPLPIRRALNIASQICASIADAHARAIIHRDLKPDNVMLQERGRTKDVVRVLDFGIAKLRDDTRANYAMTQAGDMLGTPQYMAPEQIRAEPIDGRTDVYALGCILYEMLTGRLPFEAPTVMALLSKHLMETAPPPSQRRPDLQLPPVIDDLVMSAMAKNPAQRPPTMEQLGEMIGALLATMPPDSGVATAPVSVPHVPTPPAYSAIHASPTAPAQPFTPSTPPPSGAAYAPVPLPPPAAAPPVAKKNTTTIVLVLGAAVLAAAGAAIYFVTRTEDKPAPPVEDPSKANDVDDDGDDPPDEPDDPPPPRHDDGAKPDPWGSPAGTTTSIDTSSDLLGETIDIGQGARFIVPPGFTVQRNANGVLAADVGRGIVFGFAPVDADTDDARTLAKRYARESGLRFKSVDEEFIQGANRKFAMFEGTIGNVRVRHVVIAFLSPSYRIGMIIHVPQALGNDPSVQQLAMEAATRRLLLPSSSH